MKDHWPSLAARFLVGCSYTGAAALIWPNGGWRVIAFCFLLTLGTSLQEVASAWDDAVIRWQRKEP